MSELVGLEVLFSSLSSELRCKADALVLAIHWTLVLAGLRSTDGGEEPSELLPSGWNAKSEDVYTLRYVRRSDGSETLMVKIVFADGILIVSTLKNDKQTNSVSLNVDHFVRDHDTRFQSAYRNLNELCTDVKEQLLGPLNPPRVKPDRQRDSSGLEEDPLRVPHRRPTPLESSWPDDVCNPLPAVGRGDLDPLGGPSGMLMDPRELFRPIGPGNLPRGTVPGARFDPFDPPVPDEDRRRLIPRYPGPNPDHLPPPGYDDMFL